MVFNESGDNLKNYIKIYNFIIKKIGFKSAFFFSKAYEHRIDHGFMVFDLNKMTHDSLRISLDKGLCTLHKTKGSLYFCEPNFDVLKQMSPCFHLNVFNKGSIEDDIGYSGYVNVINIKWLKVFDLKTLCILTYLFRFYTKNNGPFLFNKRQMALDIGYSPRFKIDVIIDFLINHNFIDFFKIGRDFYCKVKLDHIENFKRQVIKDC